MSLFARSELRIESLWELKKGPRSFRRTMGASAARLARGRATVFLTDRDCAARGITTEIATAPAVRAEAMVMVPGEAKCAVAPLERRLSCGEGHAAPPMNAESAAMTRRLATSVPTDSRMHSAA